MILLLILLVCLALVFGARNTALLVLYMCGLAVVAFFLFFAALSFHHG